MKVDFPEIVNDYFNNMEEEIVTNKFFKYSDEDSFVCGVNHENYNFEPIRRSRIMGIGLMVEVWKELRVVIVMEISLCLVVNQLT